MKIFLTGFAGAGKSFFGKELARLLKHSFLDTDHLIEKECGESIQLIFKNRGESFFREQEKITLRKLAVVKNAVVATGGGLPCFHDNMQWMNDHGLTVYLETSAAFLFHRLIKEKKSRPLLAELSDVELMIYITETLAAREIFYNQSQLKVNAEKCTAARLLSSIKKFR